MPRSAYPMSRGLFRLAKGACVALAAFAVSACSGFDLLNLVSAGPSAKTRDIAYGDDPRQKLDVFVPEGAGGNAPVVVFFYGGSWRTGARADYSFAGEALARLGFVAVVPDYRLYPAATFPAFQEDAALALRWARDNARSYHGDPGNIFVMGHSAGAHIGALLTVDPSYARAADVPAGTIRGFIGLAGPYAMVPSRVKSVRDVFAGLADENIARPIHFADAKAPPMLLLYGLDDGTVERANAQQFAAALQNNGTDVTLKEYPGVGHAGLAMALAPLFKGRAPVVEDINTFVARVSGNR